MQINRVCVEAIQPTEGGSEVNTTEKEAIGRTISRLQRVQQLVQKTPSLADTLVEAELLLQDMIAETNRLLGIPRWPEPTVDKPDMDTLEEWLWEDGTCEASDGCITEPDGVCPHGHPSWLLRLGFI